MATDMVKVSTTVKNYILGTKPDFVREYGFDRYTPPEVIVETLKDSLDTDEFKDVLDAALKFKVDQRQMAESLFGV